MGTFNSYLVDEQCPGCGKTIERAYQFKFAAKWQYNYHRGELLRWGGLDDGDPGLPLVFVPCAAERCPECRYDIDTDPSRGFRLRIEYDRIVSVEGPLTFSRVTFGSPDDVLQTRELLMTLAIPLGLFSIWDSASHLGASVDTTLGDWIYITGTRPDDAWNGPTVVSVRRTLRMEEIEGILSLAGLTLLRRNVTKD